MTVVTLVNNVSLSNTLQGLQTVTYIITGTHKTTVYMPFIRDNLNHPAPELGETLTQQTTLTVLKFHSKPSVPGLQVYLWALILARTRGYMSKT